MSDRGAASGAFPSSARQMVRIRASCRATVRRAQPSLPAISSPLNPSIRQTAIFRRVSSPRRSSSLDIPRRRWRRSRGSVRSPPRGRGVLPRRRASQSSDSFRTRPAPRFRRFWRRDSADRLAGRDHDQQPPEVVAIEEVGEASPDGPLAEAIEGAQRDVFLVDGRILGPGRMSLTLASPTILRKNRSQSSRTASSTASDGTARGVGNRTRRRGGHRPIA